MWIPIWICCTRDEENGWDYLKVEQCIHGVSICCIIPDLRLAASHGKLQTNRIITIVCE